MPAARWNWVKEVPHEYSSRRSCNHLVRASGMRRATGGNLPRREAYGNALRWRYVLALEVNGKTYNVDFDDWMYLMDDEVMLNVSSMSKFGFSLGEVTLSFRKQNS